MPHDVVISYSRRNREIADRLVELLRERGLDVWYDRMIKPGADWRDEIANAISDARAFVILFSSESNASEELRKELAIAVKRHLMIVPVRIEQVEPARHFEYELTRRQWLDIFADWRAGLPTVVDHVSEAAVRGAPHRIDSDRPTAMQFSRVLPLVCIALGVGMALMRLGLQSVVLEDSPSVFALTLIPVPLWSTLLVVMAHRVPSGTKWTRIMRWYFILCAVVLVSGLAAFVGLTHPVVLLVRGAGIATLLAGVVLALTVLRDAVADRMRPSRAWVLPIVGNVLVMSTFVFVEPTAVRIIVPIGIVLSGYGFYLLVKKPRSSGAGSPPAD